MTMDKEINGGMITKTGKPFIQRDNAIPIKKARELEEAYKTHMINIRWCKDCSKPVLGPHRLVPTGEEYWMCGLCKRMIEDDQNVEKTVGTENTYWKLFVDDERVGPQSKDWTFAATYEEALILIKEKGMPIEMSLDHDIWTGLIQGSNFVLLLKNKVFPDGFEYSIHSSNEEMARYMKTEMEIMTGKKPKHMKQWWS